MSTYKKAGSPEESDLVNIYVVPITTCTLPSPLSGACTKQNGWFPWCRDAWHSYLRGLLFPEVLKSFSKQVKETPEVKQKVQSPSQVILHLPHRLYTASPPCLLTQWKTPPSIQLPKLTSYEQAMPLPLPQSWHPITHLTPLIPHLKEILNTALHSHCHFPSGGPITSFLD